MPDINTSKQSFNTIIIIIGIALLLYDFIQNPEVVYFKIAGLVTLMFGLYKSTQQWTSDNKPEDNDKTTEELDHKAKNDDV